MEEGREGRGGREAQVHTALEVAVQHGGMEAVEEGHASRSVEGKGQAVEGLQQRVVVVQDAPHAGV